jgi:hypothetical protein
MGVCPSVFNATRERLRAHKVGHEGRAGERCAGRDDTEQEKTGSAWLGSERPDPVSSQPTRGVNLPVTARQERDGGR